MVDGGGGRQPPSLTNHLKARGEKRNVLPAIPCHAMPMVRCWCCCQAQSVSTVVALGRREGPCQVRGREEEAKVAKGHHCFQNCRHTSTVSRHMSKVCRPQGLLTPACQPHCLQRTITPGKAPKCSRDITQSPTHLILEGKLEEGS